MTTMMISSMALLLVPPSSTKTTIRKKKNIPLRSRIEYHRHHHPFPSHISSSKTSSSSQLFQFNDNNNINYRIESMESVSSPSPSSSVLAEENRRNSLDTPNRNVNSSSGKTKTSSSSSSPLVVTSSFLSSIHPQSSPTTATTTRTAATAAAMSGKNSLWTGRTELQLQQLQNYLWCFPMIILALFFPLFSILILKSAPKMPSWWSMQRLDQYVHHHPQFLLGISGFLLSNLSYFIAGFFLLSRPSLTLSSLRLRLSKHYQYINNQNNNNQKQQQQQQPLNNDDNKNLTPRSAAQILFHQWNQQYGTTTTTTTSPTTAASTITPTTTTPTMPITHRHTTFLGILILASGIISSIFHSVQTLGSPILAETLCFIDHGIAISSVCYFFTYCGYPSYRTFGLGILGLCLLAYMGPGYIYMHSIWHGISALAAVSWAYDPLDRLIHSLHLQNKNKNKTTLREK